ncbi:hypothetical protein P171DRAFT_429147 [Karstenula rhodostoma CBS 690.94]|uniref:Uncharacterized protein n=1 Tax=Karstenula rhodostoma CBS 690.94 TaxID=1392251 RepID=A0A9P4UEV8_9PLEO|nr:hypothetical protein P171DRAFT_429147 [Karstenula rhodostoma CBS 690.94]
MATKRKSRVDEEPSVAAARKQPRRGPDQHPGQEERQPTRKKRTRTEVVEAMEEHIFDCGCAEPIKGVCTGTWQQLLLSTVDNGQSELRMALDLVEGPWKLTPKAIVHKFTKFACDDIQWIVRYLDKFHWLYAEELSWKEVVAAIKSAAKNDGTNPRAWTRKAFHDAETYYLPMASVNKRPESSVVENANQTPARHTEQTTRNSSSTGLGGVRGTINSPLPSGSAAHPSTPPAVNPTGNSRSIPDTGNSSISCLPPAKLAPLGSRDGSNISVDHVTTPPDVSISRLETNQSSSGDSIAPVEAERDTRPRVGEELRSHRPVSTTTLRYILSKFLPTQNRFNFGDNTVKILDLRRLIHSSASEQAQDQEAGHEASESSHPVSDHDIETWTPSSLDRGGIKTFVLPFIAQPQAPSVFYVLRDPVCYVYHTTLAQENILLTRTLPDKLIRAVAGPEDAKTWKIELFKAQDCYDQSRKDDPRQEDFGLQALESCLEYAFPEAHTANKESTRFTFSIDTGFWRAVIHTAFRESAGTRYFDDWLEEKWLPQEPTPTPIHGEDPFHQYYAGTIKAREMVAKADRRQSRLARVIQDDIGKLQMWSQHARQRFIYQKETMTVKLEKMKVSADSDFRELEQKTIWNAKRYLTVTDTEHIPEVSSQYLSAMKGLYDRRYEKERNLLEAQERAAKKALRFQDQLLAALDSGKTYAKMMEIKGKDDVQKAKEFLRSKHGEETAKFNEEQARIAAEQVRTEQAARKAKEMFAGLMDLDEPGQEPSASSASAEPGASHGSRDPVAPTEKENPPVLLSRRARKELLERLMREESPVLPW